MRRGKLVDIENDPIYLLDKNRGICRIPMMGGYITVRNLKHINRDAYDANYFELEIENKRYRIQRDELESAMRYA